MPLNPDDWKAAQVELCTPENHPGSTADAKTAWAAVARDYFGNITLPAATPANQAAGEAAFAAAFDPSLGLAAFVPSLTAYAAQLALALPSSVVPPAPFVPPTLPNTYDTDAPAVAMATAVDIWTRTGTGPPPASAPWS